MPIQIKIKKLLQTARVPEKAYKGDLCYDIYSPESFTLYPNTITPIRTGIAIEPEEGWGIVIRDKSSIAVRQITVHGGEIDNAYRGEIKVLMFNHNDTPIHFTNGMKIAQLRVVKLVNIEFNEVANLSDTARGAGGFGSSGEY